MDAIKKKKIQNFTLLYGSRCDSLDFIINVHHLLWDGMDIIRFWNWAEFSTRKKNPLLEF